MGYLLGGPRTCWWPSCVRRSVLPVWRLSHTWNWPQGKLTFGPYLEGREMALSLRAQELCESWGGRPVLPVPNSPCGLSGCKATLNLNTVSEQWGMRSLTLSIRYGPRLILGSRFHVRLKNAQNAFFAWAKQTNKEMITKQNTSPTSAATAVKELCRQQINGCVCEKPKDKV